ncbi:hypothetical protein Q7P37_009999 [Cladosporium fusiforme]
MEASRMLPTRRLAAAHSIEGTRCTHEPGGPFKKSSSRVRLEEFEALKYARQLNVPVPATYEVCADTKTISMEYVEGDSLEDVWPAMSDTEKESVARQLGRIISLMGLCRQENFYIGSINGPAHDLRTYSDYSVFSIRFTHGDLSPRNIIVKNGTIQALIDWEYAGWYPEYFEYVKFFECNTSCDDWKNFAPYIFETTYQEQLVVKQAILRWQRP